MNGAIAVNRSISTPTLMSNQYGTRVNPLHMMNGIHDVPRFSGEIGVNRSISEPTLISNQCKLKIDRLRVASRHLPSLPSNQTLRSHCDLLQAQSHMDPTLPETLSGAIHRKVVIAKAKNALLASLLKRTRNPGRGGYGHESMRK